jgi:hydroxyacylglutathione hydrolase
MVEISSSSADTNIGPTTSVSRTEGEDSSSALSVVQFECLSDNYGFLLHDPVTGQTAAIDTPDGNVYQNELVKRGWTLTHIFNTHHHYDHTGGNRFLLDNQDGGGSPMKVYGPRVEEAKIPGITNSIGQGDIITFGTDNDIHILDVGGHTIGHIAYYLPKQNIVFVGDSIFALGCGRMFEGTPKQFWTSLLQLRSLPDETIVYWYVVLFCAVGSQQTIQL